MNLPSVEQRLPRATLAKTLARMLARLDNSYKAVIASREVSVLNVWAVGSYARGALTCGDLDLVVQLDSPSIRGSTANRLFFKSPARVRTYVGTPSDNSANVAFTEAVLVWQPGLDWEAAISRIQPDALAARFSRTSDAIPLRLEQLAGTWDRAHDILAGKEEGLFNWRFVPLDTVTPVEPGAQTPAEKKMERAMRYWVKGTANLALVPYLQGFSRMEGNAYADWQVWRRDEIYTEGTRYLVASLFSPSALSDITVNRVVVVPHLSTRGPNGFWVIERGVNHPLTKLFANSKAWLVASPDRTLVKLSYRNSSAHGDVSAVEIFADEAEATEYVAALDDDLPLEDGPRCVVELSGTALLNVLATVDMLNEGLPDTVFSPGGLRKALSCGFKQSELEVMTTAQLAQVFTTV